MKNKIIQIILIIFILIIIYYTFNSHKIGCLEKPHVIPGLEFPKQQQMTDISQMDSKTKAYLYVSFLIISVYLITRAF